MLKKGWVALGLSLIIAAVVSLTLPAVSFGETGIPNVNVNVNEPSGANNDGQFNDGQH
jgi:hypothetical protein